MSLLTVGSFSGVHDSAQKCTLVCEAKVITDVAGVESEVLFGDVYDGDLDPEVLVHSNSAIKLRIHQLVRAFLQGQVGVVFWDAFPF